MDNYDAWKTDAPDPGTGGTPTQIKTIFLRGYEYFARHNEGAAYLEANRGAFPLWCAEIEQDEEWFCLHHNKPLVYDRTWLAMTGGCDDCEPRDADGEDFRGGESAAYEREQQAEALRLK